MINSRDVPATVATRARIVYGAPKAGRRNETAALAGVSAHGIAGGRLELLDGRGHATTLLDPRSMRAARAFLDEA